MYRYDKRMGLLVYKDMGLSFEVLQEIFYASDVELTINETSRKQNNDIILSGEPSVVLFGGYFRR